MNLLILGGTVFLGRHLVEVGMQRGHQITLFNRGIHGPNLYPAAAKIVGDRTVGLDGLRGKEWDAVIDTSGYLPRVVRKSATALAGATDKYIFISTISVYKEPSYTGMDEHAPLIELADPSIEELNNETYGGLKVLCERSVLEVFLENALIVRPGLIVGPYDPSDRFTYWPVRVERGGEVLAPGNPYLPVQFIDGRDLAEWILMLAEQGYNGIYNATGPAERLTMHTFLETCKAVSQSDADFTWVKDEFLLEQNVVAYSEMPVWLPEVFTAMSEVGITKALNHQLTFRPLAETIADTLKWHKTRPADMKWRAGISRTREEELLRLWKTSALG